MKRTFTQKVKPVQTCAAESLEGLAKSSEGNLAVGAAIPTEVNRRTRTSAAMIGLAISMGASGLLLPQQGDEAMAVEPIAASPSLPTGAVTPETSISTRTEAEPEVSSASKASEPKRETIASKPPVIKHQVEQGQTLWELSQNYEVQPEAIAASNKIEPSGTLSVGQTLKIPAVNGIVHEVKAGETVETVSKSYGVESTQLQTEASGKLQAGASVTVPGQVNDLLKARQDLAIENLKEKRNRLNESLAELRSEESSNLSKPSAKAESSSTGAVPPVMLKSEQPVVIPVPTPEIAASPTVSSEGRQPFQYPVVIPVPTPETATSPKVESHRASQSPASVVIPVPTPDTAASLAVESKSPPQLPSVVVNPAAMPATTDSGAAQPQAIVIPKISTDPVPVPEVGAKPPVAEPVVIQPLVASRSANVYQVKPGDTLDAIARRYGLSRDELIQVNGINNPNLIRVNQQLKIPSSQPAGTTPQPVTLLPGITSNSNNIASRQEQPKVETPLLVVPTLPTPVAPTVPPQLQFQPPAASSPVLAQSNLSNEIPTNPTVVVDARRNQTANSNYNPYVERLRADVLKVREDYRRQGANAQVNIASNVVVPTVPVAPPRLANQATLPRTNPEFNPQRYQQETQQAAIPIDVPAPANSAATSQQQLVAVAPAPADSYNPMLQIPVGQTVSPELPPLSAPDMYLPDSPARFNGYMWPTKGVLTSGYGMRWGRMHKGIDIAAPIGTPIFAAASGVVVTAGWNSGGYGNLVEIQHPDGSLTLYAHNNRILVRSGQEVVQGEQISEMGSTGYSTGPHLHFEVHPTGRGAVNPIAYLPKNR